MNLALDIKLLKQSVKPKRELSVMHGKLLVLPRSNVKRNSVVRPINPPPKNAL